MQQLQTIFFDRTPNREYPHVPLPPSREEVEMLLARDNSDLALNEVIVSPQNEGNMRILRDFLFTAFMRWNHSLRGCNFGIGGGSGQGKTYIVKQFADSAKLPFVFVQCGNLSDSHKLFQLMEKAAEKAGTPLVPCKTRKADYVACPMVVFFDEAHAIPKRMMTGGLLNAMEADDSLLEVKRPGVRGEAFTIDCKDICWVAATTEKGKLFDAFANRLGPFLEWAPAGPEEIAQIVEMQIQKRSNAGELQMAMPWEACELVAQFQRVPREARDFAILVVQRKQADSSLSWEEACRQVSDDLRRDGNLTEKQVAILTALGQRPVAKGRLPSVAGCRIEQVEKYELPLLTSFNNGGPFVIPTSRGMCITEAGLRELDRRAISHRGHRVTAEYFEERRHS